MTYVERLKALIVKHGGSADGIKTVSDAIAVLEGLEEKKPVTKTYNRPSQVSSE